MHLASPPKKFCLITIVFDFSSWDDCNTQEKFQRMVTAVCKFLFVCVVGVGGGGETGPGEKKKNQIGRFKFTQLSLKATLG